jgi:signal transduction histidine kinase/AmiR/NasT family two-component response regulator
VNDGSAAVVSLLLVEDNPDHRLLAERTLLKAGFAVRTASSGEEALELSTLVDLVLLDYRLPRMSGIEVLKELRRRNGPAVVFVTGMGSEEIAVEAMRAGAVDYIVKNPGYLAALPKAVERAWRHHDLARRAASLEQLALMVTSVTERREVVPEIARGLRSLLRADACLVVARMASGLAIEAVDGDPFWEAGEIVDEVAAFLASGHGVTPEEPTDRLLVPLPGTDGENLGALVLMTRTPRRFLPEEIRLARTLASFAGIALANATRLELERRLAAELQGMLDMRTKLVTSVSHELRTPLTSILGFAETLAERWAAFADEQRLEFIGIIRRQALELADLVDGLLDYATTQAGRVKIDIGRLAMPEFLGAILDDLAPLLDGRPVALEGEPAVVLGDGVLIRRVLSNLLSNAVKYSEPDTAITVRCCTEAGRCRIEVLDRGPGLTAEEAALAFEPFWRAGRDDWTVRGSGIGLSLVREYARLMNGEAGVESKPGWGSRFYLTLPLADAAAIAS